MSEETFNQIGIAILILVVVIIIIFIAFPILKGEKEDIFNIYSEVFGLKNPEEEIFKEKKAIDIFNSFLEQLDNCLKLGEVDCTCDFSLGGLGDYKIEISEDSGRETQFTLIDKEGVRSSITSKEVVFGIADEEGCVYVQFDKKTGYRTTELSLKDNNFLLKFVNRKGKNDEKEFTNGIPKIYVDKLPKRNQLCFITNGYEEVYKDKLSCEDVPKKRAVEKRGDIVVNKFFNQLDECLSKRNKDCTCSLGVLGLKADEKLIFRIGEGVHEIHLAKNGFTSEPTKYTFNFKIAEGDGQKKECNSLSLSSIYYYINVKGDKFYLNGATTGLGDSLEKDHEIYISSSEDENTICFLKKGVEVPPVC